MLLNCAKGRHRRFTKFPNSIAFHGVSSHGLAEQRSATRVPTPPGTADEYAAMIQRTPLRDHPPGLEFYDDLGDVGGMFVGPDWAIMLGLGDMQRLTCKVLGQWSPQVAAIYRARNGAPPTAHALYAYAVHSATLRCLAHELGHALICAGSVNPFAPDGEAGADYYAGRFDAEMGRSPELGALFFLSIGCTGHACNHPSPSIRATAHRAGFDAQLLETRRYSATG
jgi:hypothetical protein